MCLDEIFEEESTIKRISLSPRVTSPAFRKSTPSSLVTEPELGKPPDSRLKSNL